MSKFSEKEIVEFAKTNDYCWAGLKRRHPEVATWMEGHKFDCRQVRASGHTSNVFQVGFSDGLVYRLRPDYELLSLEDQAKASLDSDYTLVGYGKDEEKNLTASGYIARYFYGEWYYEQYNGNNPEVIYAVRNDAPDDIWQRFGIERNPHKPQAGWVEYDVTYDKEYGYSIEKRLGLSRSINLSDCIDIRGFGGIQFRRHDGTLTEFFTDRLAHIEDDKPCDPVKVRFWEVM